MIRVAAAWPEVKWPEAIVLFLCLCVHYGKDWIKESRPNSVIESLVGDLTEELKSVRDDVGNLESKMSGIELQKGITTSIGDEG